MPSLAVYSRYTPSTRALLRTASALGWTTARVEERLPDELVQADSLAIFSTPPLAYELASQAGRRLLSCPLGWEASLGEPYLRRKLRSAPLAEIEAPRDEPFFLKPALSKSFEPAVYVYEDLAALAVSEDAQVLLSEPVRFECELRFFVARGRVAASAFTHLQHERLKPRSSVPPSAHREALEFVTRLLEDDSLSLPPGFVLDVGQIEGRGWAVVEANEAWASGLYGCDPADVLPVLLACCVPGDSPDAVWDQAQAFAAARGRD